MHRAARRVGLEECCGAGSVGALRGCGWEGCWRVVVPVEARWHCRQKRLPCVWEVIVTVRLRWVRVKGGKESAMGP